MDVSYQIINVCTELANNANDVIYFNSVSNVCDLLTLLISGKNSFNFKNAKDLPRRMIYLMVMSCHMVHF